MGYSISALLSQKHVFNQIRISCGGEVEGIQYLGDKKQGAHWSKRGSLNYQVLGGIQTNAEVYDSFSRLQICPLYMFGNSPPQMGFYGSMI